MRAWKALRSEATVTGTQCPAGRSKLDVPERHYATGQCAFPAQFIFPKKLFYINYPRIKLELQLCLIGIWNIGEKRENHEKITLLTNFLFPLQ